MSSPISGYNSRRAGLCIKAKGFSYKIAIVSCNQVGPGVASWPPEQQQLAMVTAFKVARACAAACLLPSSRLDTVSLDEVLSRQARLQPLKYQHFDRRTLHIGQQVQEVCRKVQESARATARASVTVTGTDPAASGARADTQPNSQAPPLTVLVLLGRQHVPRLRELWGQPSSRLHRGSVPHTFADSG